MAGVPVCLCGDDQIDAAIERTNRTLSEVVDSPNYARLMQHGDARSIGDVLICGSEATMEKRLRSFADAGVTDLNCRIVPLGEGRDADQGVGRAHPGVPGGGGAFDARHRLRGTPSSCSDLPSGAGHCEPVAMPRATNSHISSAARALSCGSVPLIVDA